MFGWRRDEVIGRTVAETIIPEQFRKAHEDGLQRFLATGRGDALNTRIEIQARHRTGQEFPVELTVAPHSLGGERYFSAFLRDISDRRRTEAELAEQADFLNRVLESLSHPFCVVDPKDYSIKIANRAARESGAEGATPSYAMCFGRDASCTLTGDDCPIREVRRTREPTTAMHTCVGRDGAERTFDVHAYPLLDAAGEVSQVILYSIDVSARRQTEERMRRLACCVESAGEAIVMTDLNGAILYVNPAFARLTGYAAEEMIGRNPRVLRSGRHPQAFYEKMWNTILSGERWTGELVNRRKDGSLYDVELTIAPVMGEKGIPEGLVAVQRDITEQKEVEASLRSARDAADAANSAKSEFLAKMSHELRTPLNSIIGFTEMMVKDREDPPTERRARRLEKVHRNSRSLLALINDILDISKIEANRFVLEYSAVDVATLLHECVDATQHLVTRGRVQVELALDDTVAGDFRWSGDEVRLRQIVTKLLSNAAKFTDCGRIEVRGRLDAGMLEIEVDDTGIGIPQEHLRSVFGEFEQVDSSSTRRASGTGLGLAICRRLCELMGGGISVRSQIGVGSCFTIRLPRRTEEGSPGRAVAEDASGSLVVCCGSEASCSWAGALSVPGLCVERATDVLQALDVWVHRSPAMFWVDPLWPASLRLIAELKSRARGARMPIGFLGVIGDRGAIFRFDDFVVVPIMKDTLLKLTGTREDDTTRSILVVAKCSVCDDLTELLAEVPGVDVRWAKSISEARNRLHSEWFDVVLMGLSDPSGMSFSLFDEIPCGPDGRRPRVIAVTPREPEEADVEAFRCGFRSRFNQFAESLEEIADRARSETLATLNAVGLVEACAGS